MKIIKHLLEVANLIKTIANTSSTNEKKQILENTKETDIEETLKKVLIYTYGDNVYNIGKAKVKGLMDMPITNVNMPVPFNDLFIMLDYLSKLDGVSNDTLNQVISHLTSYPLEIRELAMNIILKDLRAGFTANTVNKIWKDLIPQFKLQLGSKYIEKKNYLEGKEVSISEKFDGIRCAIIIKDGSITFKSRQNKIMTGYGEIEDELKTIKDLPDNVLIDGELLYKDNTLPNDVRYRKTMEIVGSKDENKKDLIFVAFDIINLDEFKHDNSKVPYKERLKALCRLFSPYELKKEEEVLLLSPFAYKSNVNTQFIKMIRPLYYGRYIEDIALEMLEVVLDLEKEGLMINVLDDPYSCKRTKSLQKLKALESADVRIIGYEEGQGKYEGQLGALIINYKDNEVRVGSGLKDNERVELWANKEDLIGKIVEINYTEESKNKNNDLISLRFPRFKGLRPDKTEPSYN